MRIFKYGDDVNTDLIIPARYLNSSASAHLASHCMEDLDPNFASAVRPGDAILAGKNFGCGSSREHAALAIRDCGIAAVIAESFARIFYRNAINIGLRIIESPEIARETSVSDSLRIDTREGLVENLSTGKIYSVPKFPAFVRTIVERGGLMNCLDEIGGFDNA